MNKTEINYPYNLLCAVLGEEPETLAEDFEASVEYVLMSTLTERECGVIRQRYKDGLTYEECGKAWGVTRERIRQVEIKTIRKLRHPSRLQFLRLGVRGTIHEAAQKVADKNYHLINECVKKAMDAEKGEVTVEEKPDLELYELDLSVRSYNCLKRAGCKKVSDILRMDYQKFTHIRNMGRKSCNEVIAVLNRLGYNTYHLEGGVDNG